MGFNFAFPPPGIGRDHVGDAHGYLNQRLAVITAAHQRDDFALKATDLINA
jgi:hypothetical protein